VLEGAQARHGVERAKALGGDLPRILEVDVQAVAPARSDLRGGQGDAHPGGTLIASEVQERPPATPEVEHPSAGADAYLLGYVVVLAPLSLLKTERKIAVVLGSTEVRELPQAEPEDAIDQRIRELEICAVSHLWAKR
jgi:hypothetical protein